MERKIIRDLIGGALLIATAVVYFWTAVPRWPEETAVTPTVTIEATGTPASEGV